MKNKTTRIISIILISLTGLMVAMSGIMKVIGSEEIVQKMSAGGFGPYITLFGIIELVSVAFLFFRKTFKTGFLLLCCYLGGALAVELSAGEPPIAAFLLTVLWVGSYLRDKSLFAAEVKTI